MRKTTLVAAGAVLVLTLTACGAKSDSGAPANTGDTGSAQPELGLASPFTDAIKLASAAKDGASKSKSAKFSMESAASGKSVTGTGQASFDGANTSMALVTETDGNKSEVRYVGKTLYIKLPPEQLKEMGADGKPWMKISADSDNPMGQLLAGAMQQSSEQSDPTRALDQISKAGRIVSSDQTQLNGVPVNHYVVELDIAKAIDQFTSALPAAMKSKLADTLKGKDVKLPAELWIDKDQLPRQIVIDSGPLLKAVGAPAGGAAKTTVKYTDWGQPVDVQAPPADQVTDFDELLKKAGQ